jgi:hypothetical protein
MTKVRDFDVSEYLDSPEAVAAYLREAFETGEDDLLTQAVGAVRRSPHAAFLNFLDRDMALNIISDEVGSVTSREAVPLSVSVPPGIEWRWVNEGPVADCAGLLLSRSTTYDRR